MEVTAYHFKTIRYGIIREHTELLQCPCTPERLFVNPTPAFHSVSFIDNLFKAFHIVAQFDELFLLYESELGKVPQDKVKTRLTSFSRIVSRSSMHFSMMASRGEAIRVRG